MKTSLKETELFLEICERERKEIDFTDHRPSMFGSTFKKMNLSQMEYYLNYTKNTAKKKKEFRKMVGWFRYYFVYSFKFLNSYNAHFYTR